jgi:hypothetical protein
MQDESFAASAKICRLVPTVVSILPVPYLTTSTIKMVTSIKKYRQATEHIRTYGYDVFLEIADQWKNAHGKYER